MYLTKPQAAALKALGVSNTLSTLSYLHVKEGTARASNIKMFIQFPSELPDGAYFIPALLSEYLQGATEKLSAPPEPMEGERAESLSIDAETFAQLAEYVSDDETRYFMQGVCAANGGASLAATDGRRLAYAGAVAGTGEGIIIPPYKGTIEALRAAQGRAEKISEEGAAPFLRIVTPDYTFTSCLIEGQFPNYARVIPENNGQASVHLPSAAWLKGAKKAASANKVKMPFVLFDTVSASWALDAAPAYPKEAATFAAGEAYTLKLNLGYLLTAVKDGVASLAVRWTARNDEYSPLTDFANASATGAAERYQVVIMPATRG